MEWLGVRSMIACRTLSPRSYGFDVDHDSCPGPLATGAYPLRVPTRLDMTPATSADADVKAVEQLRDAHRRLRIELGKIIVGQDAVLDQLLMAIFCRSHALLVGVPGLAKTLMVSTLAQALDLSF